MSLIRLEKPGAPFFIADEQAASVRAQAAPLMSVSLPASPATVHGRTSGSAVQVAARDAVETAGLAAASVRTLSMAKSFAIAGTREDRFPVRAPGAI
jgi:hypothetical protein